MVCIALSDHCGNKLLVNADRIAKIVPNQGGGSFVYTVDEEVFHSERSPNDVYFDILLAQRAAERR